jgi:hypothetical protein
LRAKRTRALLARVTERRSSRRARFSAWIQAVAALAALVVAGEHSLTSLHQILTVHEVCAAHGELVHAGETHGAIAPHGTERAWESGAQAEAEHHHCGTVPAAPLRAPAVAATNGCALGPVVVVASFESFDSDLPTADVLAYAPKLSPPV